MKKICLLGLAGLAAALAGCVDKGLRHRFKAETESAAGRYQECVEQATIAIDMKRGDRDPGMGIKSLKTAPPNHEMVKYLLLTLGQSLELRAGCQRQLGKIPEAIADTEKSVQAYSDACARKDELIQLNNVCKAAADQAEKLAKWKKELAQSKP